MTAIEFENISKQYRLGLVSTRTLSHDLNRWWTMNILRKEDPYLKIGEVNDRSHKGKSEYVWALRDINFKVEQGDVVGIIGKNVKGVLIGVIVGMVVGATAIVLGALCIGDDPVIAYGAQLIVFGIIVCLIAVLQVVLTFVKVPDAVIAVVAVEKEPKEKEEK